ncbi:hypothetical protein BDV96DRAFT_649393 [Lophiotrema nucula]|uniref:Uncharacterized protein n=1 Tax=Lophiotrema nucula TaxID=690887 RepID=A0A6A5YY51_9PLEO|nr:hypothetical protein BDV96DRAFT_649393 [Lophiotrema nucula]
MKIMSAIHSIRNKTQENAPQDSQFMHAILGRNESNLLESEANSPNLDDTDERNGTGDRKVSPGEGDEDKLPPFTQEPNSVVGQLSDRVSRAEENARSLFWASLLYAKDCDLCEARLDFDHRLVELHLAKGAVTENSKPTDLSDFPDCEIMQCDHAV